MWRVWAVGLLLCFSSLFGFLVVFFTTCVSPAGFRHVMYDWAFRYVMYCQGVSISARAYRYAVAVVEISTKATSRPSLSLYLSLSIRLSRRCRCVVGFY